MLTAVTFIGVGALLVAVALLAIATRPRDLVSRALACYLVLQAGGLAAYGLLHDPLAPGDAEVGLYGLYWTELPLVFVLPLLLDALFGSVPRSRARKALLAGSGALALALTGSLLVARGPVFQEPIVVAGVELLPPGPLLYGVLLFALHIGALLAATRVASSPERSILQRKQAAVVGIAFAILVGHAGVVAIAYSGYLLALFENAAVAPALLTSFLGLLAMVPAWRRLPRAFDGTGRLAARVAILAGMAFAVVEGATNAAYGALGVSGRVWFYGRAIALLAFALILVAGALRYGIAGLAIDVPARRLLPARLFLPASEPAAVVERARLYGTALRARSGRDPAAVAQELAPLRRDLGLSERDHALLAAALAGVSADSRLLLGRFALDRPLARGATATVHLARDTLAGREVVVKEIADARLDAGPFLAEARALARLDHPNVVRLLSAETLDGRLYLVLEHARGGSLAQRLARGALPHAEAARVVDQILSALEAAHAAGIVHGDIKPENVLFAEDGRALLADFGAAAFAADPDATVRAASLAGSPASMAPELFLGERPTTASDVFAVCTLLYRCLTGEDHVDLSGASAREMQRRALFAPTRLPHALVPPRIERVLAAGLAKEPADRPASASELRALLRAAFREERVSAALDQP